jgi:Ca2+-binding EF-hand superfamily protein
MTIRSRGISIVATFAGVMLSAAVFAGNAQTSWDNEMEMMDANHDGKITAAEHVTGAKKMFTTMDTNQDGKVTAAEMDSAQMKMKGHDTHADHAGAGHEGAGHQMSSSEKIKTVDADGDGVLTAAEHERASRKMFDAMDADHDGTLTAAEVKTGHEKMMMSKKPGGDKAY